MVLRFLRRADLAGFRPAAGFVALISLGISLSISLSVGTVWAQAPRPEAGPFDPAMMQIQSAPPQGVAVRAGRMFDARSGTLLTNQVIVIQGDRIVEVGPAANVKIPQSARVIDLSRATVLPGFIDRHVHLMQDPQPNDGRVAYIGLHYALKNLYAGFTTLEDMGSESTYATVELRDAINKGLVLGPRLQVAGRRSIFAAADMCRLLRFRCRSAMERAL